MDYAKQIHILDNAIATLNSELSSHYSDGSSVKSRGEALKKMSILALADANSSRLVKSAVENVSFYSVHCTDFPIPMGSFNDRINGIDSTFQQGVKSLIDILQQERTRLLKEQADKEQTRSKQIAKWTLIFSAIAAICAIISVVLAIF